MKESLLFPAIILISLVVVAYETNPGIAPCLIPWALPTWGWVLGLPSVGHRMSHGGKSGSGRDTVIRNTPCQWISCSQSPLVRSVKRDLGQRGRCPWGFTKVNVCWSALGDVWCWAPPRISSWIAGFIQNLNSCTNGNDSWSSLALRETHYEIYFRVVPLSTITTTIKQNIWTDLFNQQKSWIRQA